MDESSRRAELRWNDAVDTAEDLAYDWLDHVRRQDPIVSDRKDPTAPAAVARHGRLVPRSTESDAPGTRPRRQRHSR